MDSLTQIVLGAAVGEAVLGKKVGNRAMLWGGIAGTIPDLDVFIKYFTDPITSTEMHRGISHSLFFSVVMAFILGWAVFKKEKVTMAILAIAVLGLVTVMTPNLTAKIIFSAVLLGTLTLIYFSKISSAATKLEWGKLFFWSLVTHPLLDAHTTWGTQFFWPFEYRLAYQNIFVADPLYTLPFLFFVIIAMCYKRANPKRRMFNNIGLIVSTSYMALTFVLKGIGYSKFLKAAERDKISYVEMDTQPTALNTILWNSQIETKTGFRTGYYSFFDSKKITFSPEIPKNHHLLEPYKNQKVVKQLIKISTGWYFVEQAEDGLIFTDTRFGQSGFEKDAPFFWRYKLTMGKDGVMKAVQMRGMQEKMDFGKALGDLKERIKGN